MPKTVPAGSTDNVEESANTTDNTADATRLPADHPLVTALERQKAEIAALKARTKKLDEIEDAQKTEAQKAAEKLAAAERDREEALAVNHRLRLAIKHRLAEDDVALLDGVTDPEALERLASRLAPKEEETPPAGGPRRPRPDPTQGGTGTGKTTPADLFAAAVSSHLT